MAAIISEGIAGFVLAGLALAGSPGPATLSLAATGAAFGTRKGLAYLTGLVIGLLAVMGIVASGLTGLMLALPGVRLTVTLLAGAYFLYLAFRIATAPPLAADGGTDRQPSFTAGFLLSLVNPKGYAAMAAMFSGFVLIQARPGLDFLAKAAALTVLIVAVDLAWLQAGAALTRFFHDPKASRLLNLAFATLLVASLVFMLPH